MYIYICTRINNIKQIPRDVIGLPTGGSFSASICCASRANFCRSNFPVGLRGHSERPKGKKCRGRRCAGSSNFDRTVESWARISNINGQ